MKTKNQYTKEETALYFANRNAKRDAERKASKQKEMIWLSSDPNYLLKYGVPNPAAKGIFKGSIRNQFTGPKRNNFQQI